MHMKANYALPVEFDAPVMLNVIKQKRTGKSKINIFTQIMALENKT